MPSPWANPVATVWGAIGVSTFQAFTVRVGVAFCGSEDVEKVRQEIRMASLTVLALGGATTATAMAMAFRR